MLWLPDQLPGRPYNAGDTFKTKADELSHAYDELGATSAVCMVR